MQKQKRKSMKEVNKKSRTEEETQAGAELGQAQSQLGKDLFDLIRFSSG